MSCSHASTTTVAWAFGELDGSIDAEAHALHVAACDDCMEALDALEMAEAAAAPLAGALAAEPEVVAPVPPVPSPANRPSLRIDGLRKRVFGAVALVAAVALGTMAALVDDRLVSEPTEDPVAVRVAPTPPPVPVTPPALDLDDELDALELELDALRTDPSIL